MQSMKRGRSPTFSYTRPAGVGTYCDGILDASRRDTYAEAVVAGANRFFRLVSP